MSQNSADDPPDYALIGEEGFDLSEINIEDVLKAAIEQPERFQQTISLCMNSEDFVPQLAHEVSLKNDLWEELQHGESLFPKLVECINQIEVKDEKNKQVKKKFPDSAFSKAHVAYYRNKFRKEGMDIPLLREVEGEEAPPKAKVKAKAKTKK